MRICLIYICLLVTFAFSADAVPAPIYAENIDASGIQHQDATCKLSNGSVTGIKGNSSWLYTWTNKFGAVVGNNLDLTGIGQGWYVLTYRETVASPSRTYGPVFIKNTTGPNMDDSDIHVTAGSCAASNGTIKGIKVTETATISAYIFSNVKTRQNYFVQTPELTGAAPGTYVLKVVPEDRCEIITSVEIVVPGTGQIDVDATGLMKHDENCGAKDGGVTGVVIRNPQPGQRAVWTNDAFQVVGNSLDLSGVPGGKYTLTIDYENGGCPVALPPVNITNKGGPEIDYSAMTIVNAFCGNRHGSITGIKVKGKGKIAYKWIDNTGKTVSTDSDYYDAPANGYQLIVTDESGCGSTISKAFSVDNLPPGYPFDLSTAIVTMATCDNPGAVTGIVSNPFMVYEWRDELNAVISTKSELTNAVGGIYKFRAHTICDTIWTSEKEFDLGIRRASFKEFAVTKKEPCDGQTNGRIRVNTDVFVVARRWVNAAGDILGTDDELTDVGPGTYRLYLSNLNCEVLYNTYTLDNKPGTSAPVVNDVEFCSDSGTIIVGNPAPGNTYRLYPDNTSATPIQTSNDNKFAVTVPGDVVYYVSQANADCESPRSPVKITAGLLPADIPTAFTPNGDGRNDQWIIRNVQKYPKIMVQVFNRAGQQVFNSRGYGKPFDGTLNGRQLESGSYFYIINPGGGCKLSGTLTLIR